MNKSRAKTRAGKIITQPLAQSAYLSLLIAFMLFTSFLLCAHMHARAHMHAHTHTQGNSCIYMLFFRQKHIQISEDTHAHPNLLGLFPTSAEKYIMIITVWAYIPELTRSDTHTSSRNARGCGGVYWLKRSVREVLCWGSGPFSHCSLLKPPGSHLSKTERCAGPIKTPVRPTKSQKDDTLC